jgi:ferredoxin
MKLVLNSATCDRHGQCAGAAPTLLAWNADGSLKVLKETLAPEDREEAEDACALCPTQSLSIED